MLGALCTLILVASSYGQIPSQQIGPLMIEQLADSVPITGVLLPSSSAASLHVQLYQFWLPYTAFGINVTIARMDSACSRLFFSVSTIGFPCSMSEFGTRYPCGSGYDVPIVNPFVLSPDPNDNPRDLMAFSVNRPWYIAVGKYYSTESAATCNYMLTAKVASECPAGQVAISTSFSGLACIPFVSLDGPNFATGISLSNINADGNTPRFVYKLNVTQNTGNIRIQVNATTNAVGIFGKSYTTAKPFSNNNCKNPTPVKISNVLYVYDFYCYTPRTGDFFITFQNTNTQNYNVTFSITAKVCEEGFGGYNCTYNSTRMFSEEGMPGSVSLPYGNNNGITASFGAAYYYIDTSEDYLGKTLEFEAFAISNGANMMWRRDGFPTLDTESGQEIDVQRQTLSGTVSVFLNDFEWKVPGRIYFGLLCTNQGGCNIGWRGNFTVDAPVTTGSLTTKALTTASLTTGSLTTKSLTTQSQQQPADSTSGEETSFNGGTSNGDDLNNDDDGLDFSSASVVVHSIFVAGIAIGLIF
eukprot:TRINITY_DN1205_c0_g1_i1.p1 TRINITY_DN1205_c0_g1~~TRINITY_DN1205_c0_g1_i1.p1  ORF type:complete len:527 (+),score=68.55 TRINITY_DN1205_c0_g1_i1:29-1609(+)